eukprot:SAG11_NODE_30951_length_296_cov_0.736041_1_plen_29_part_10
MPQWKRNIIDFQKRQREAEGVLTASAANA